MSAAVALCVDALVGDVPLRPHPVAVFGNAMEHVETRTWSDDRVGGLLYALRGILGAAGAGYLLGLLPGGASIAGYVAVGGRGLWDAARDVADALDEGDLELARALLPWLVGRDPAGMDESEIVRAVVESVAENSVDAIVAPALFTAWGGASAAFAYRAANTLDAMVGRRDVRYGRFGWASARADDLANLLPARFTALLVACLRPAKAADIWRSVRHDAPAHPSPNAGVAESAFAAALGLQLGGESRYGEMVERRPILNPRARPPERADIKAAVALSQQVTVSLGAVLATPGLLSAAGRAISGRARNLGAGAPIRPLWRGSRRRHG